MRKLVPSEDFSRDRFRANQGSFVVLHANSQCVVVLFSPQEDFLEIIKYPSSLSCTHDHKHEPDVYYNGVGYSFCCDSQSVIKISTDAIDFVHWDDIYSELAA